MVNETVREIQHRVRVNLPADMPPMKTATGRRRKPLGLRLDYAVSRGITRVDITVEYHNEAEYFPPVAEMPAWMREIVDRHRPADVDSPDANRRTGMGGWPLKPVKPSVISDAVVLRQAADDVALDRDYQLPADGPLKPGMDRAEKLLRRQADLAEAAGL